MKAIKVSFLQATGSRPCRLRATDGDGHSLTQTYEYIDADEQAFELAKALIKKLEWRPCKLEIGSYKNDWYVVQTDSF
jgi:hypothetical protein